MRVDRSLKDSEQRTEDRDVQPSIRDLSFASPRFETRIESEIKSRRSNAGNYIIGL